MYCAREREIYGIFSPALPSAPPLFAMGRETQQPADFRVCTYTRIHWRRHFKEKGDERVWHQDRSLSLSLSTPVCSHSSGLGNRAHSSLGLSKEKRKEITPTLMDPPSEQHRLLARYLMKIIQSWIRNSETIKHHSIFNWLNLEERIFNPMKGENNGRLSNWKELIGYRANPDASF